MAPEQLALFGDEEPAFDLSAIERIDLPGGAWLDRVRGFLRGHTRVYEALAATTRWRSDRRMMYDREVDVPRLFAIFPDDGPGHPICDPMRRALSEHYQEDLVRVSAAWYRDGRDSVAWHGDYVARKMERALVATVSVGAPRKFLLRPHGGGRSRAMTLGWGDLLVMGGTCQRTWQHSVPKVAQAEPRIAIMFRPRWQED